MFWKKLCKCANCLRDVHCLFIFVWYYRDSSKERYERRCNGVYLYHYTYNFFHNNRPGKPLPGHSSFLGLFLGSFFCGRDGERDGRTAGGAAAWSCLVRSFRRVILSV